MESDILRLIGERIAAGDDEGAGAAFLDILDRRWVSATLRSLDDAGLLTAIIPELEPARACDQPRIHFLPVLAHSLEAVAVADWIFDQLGIDRERATTGDEGRERSPQYAADPHKQRSSPTLRPSAALLPVAVQRNTHLTFHSKHAAALRARLVEPIGAGRRRAALFRLGALLHDVAKPETKEDRPDGTVSFYGHQTVGADVAREVARRLGLAGVEVDYVATIVREHMRPGQLTELDDITPRAIRRFFSATDDAGPDVLLHALADHMATRGPRLNVAAWYAQLAWTDALLEAVWGDEVELVRPLVNGHELMAAFGLKPGPLLGRLLAAIGEAQAGGDVTSKEEALELAAQLLGS